MIKSKSKGGRRFQISTSDKTSVLEFVIWNLYFGICYLYFAISPLTSHLNATKYKTSAGH